MEIGEAEEGEVEETSTIIWEWPPYSLKDETPGAKEGGTENVVGPKEYFGD